MAGIYSDCSTREIVINKLATEFVVTVVRCAARRLVVCSKPIPDYYSITLEISRDRTTAADEFVCNSKDRARPACPAGHSDGDVYLRRTLNEACQKMVSSRSNVASIAKGPDLQNILRFIVRLS